MNPLKIKIGVPISFSLGHPPVSEVFANPAMLAFEDDKIVPGEDGKSPTVIKGKAVLTWGVTEGGPGVHAHPISVKLDDTTTDMLRKLITEKTRESLDAASKASRGA